MVERPAKTEKGVFREQEVHPISEDEPASVSKGVAEIEEISGVVCPKEKEISQEKEIAEKKEEE